MPLSLLILLVFSSSAIIAMATIPVLQRVAARFGFYDVPDSPKTGGAMRKIHAKPIPRLGGVAIFLAFFASGLIWFSELPFRGVFWGSVGIFLLGALDDIRPLPAKLRFFVQLMIVGSVIYFETLMPVSLLVSSDVHIALSQPAAFLFSTFFVVGAINSFNMIDGLDGLAGGLSVISVSILSLLYFWNRHDVWLLLCIAAPLLGGVIGFLRYNTHPATIFMGDCGSNWIGYLLGMFMLILLSGSTIGSDFNPVFLSNALPIAKDRPPVPLVSVISSLAVPIFDTAVVMLARIRRGQNPMVADRRHIHHSLLRIGLRHGQAVSAVYFLAVLFGFVGILPVVYPRYDLSWVSLVGLLFLVLLLVSAMNLDAHSIQGALSRRSFFRRAPNYTSFSKLIRYWENANRYVLYLILFAGPAFAGAVRKDVGYAALVAGCLIALSIVASFFWKRDDFIDAICVAVGAVVLLVANNTNYMMVEWQGERLNIHWIYNALFFWLFGSTFVLFFATIKKRYLVFRSSDFLLAVVPLVMLLVPEPYKSELRLDIISIRSVVAFIALRTLAKRKNYVVTHVKGVTLVALIFVFFAGVYGLRIVY